MVKTITLKDIISICDENLEIFIWKGNQSNRDNLLVECYADQKRNIPESLLDKEVVWINGIHDAECSIDIIIKED